MKVGGGRIKSFEVPVHLLHRGVEAVVEGLCRADAQVLDEDVAVIGVVGVGVKIDTCAAKG